MRIWFLLIMVFTLFSINVSTSYATSDIAGHGNETEIRDLIDRKIMEGNGSGLFYPNNSITRAEFTLLIVRSLNLPDTDKKVAFKDLPGREETKEAITKAYTFGIINGYSEELFKPENKITREQMAAMIHRSLQYKGILGDIGDLNFPDKDDIAPQFKDAVSHVSHFNIVRGHTNGNFAPKQDASRGHAAAFISRLIGIIEAAANVSDEPEPIFQLATINSSGELDVHSREYGSFQDAKNAKEQTSQLILSDSHIVEMQEGLVRPKGISSTKLVSIFKNSDLSNTMTYVTSAPQFSSEMKYIESNDKVTKVSHAGRTGYVSTSAITLWPKQKVQNRQNHYTVNQWGTLVHNLYNRSTDRYSGYPYTYGPAPSFLKQGERYLSADGNTFYTLSGTKVGQEYQYFNALPVKTKTNYTAEELDSFIDQNTKIRTNSKLIDQGETFMKAQEETGINALFIMAAAIHESAWGTSDIAQGKLNTFGMKAVDSSAYDSATGFETVEDNILYFATKYMKNGYTHYDDWRYEGAFPGNKGEGFNVRYASDAFWGQKIAKYMYLADIFLGFKDSSQYVIAKTTFTNELNVRKGPGKEYDTIFKYTSPGSHVVIHEEVEASDGSIWYKVSADHKDHLTAYIHSSFLEKLNYVEVK